MAHLRMTARHDAPIDRVFELLTAFERYPEWNTTYTEVDQVVGPRDKVGTRVHATMRFLGRKMEGWAEIVEIEPPRLLKLSGSSTDGGQLTMLYRLEPAGEATEATLEADYELPGGFIGVIADKLFVERAVERDVRHSIENFKAVLELKEPVHA